MSYTDCSLRITRLWIINRDIYKNACLYFMCALIKHVTTDGKQQTSRTTICRYIKMLDNDRMRHAFTNTWGWRSCRWFLLDSCTASRSERPCGPHTALLHHTKHSCVRLYRLHITLLSTEQLNLWNTLYKIVWFSMPYSFIYSHYFILLFHIFPYYFIYFIYSHHHLITLISFQKQLWNKNEIFLIYTYTFVQHIHIELIKSTKAQTIMLSS